MSSKLSTTGLAIRDLPHRFIDPGGAHIEAASILQSGQRDRGPFVCSAGQADGLNSPASPCASSPAIGSGRSSFIA
jgi:hypothetical protein